MRILLDASTLVVGGGIQVALGILKRVSSDSHRNWHVVLSRELADALPSELESILKYSTVFSRSIQPFGHIRRALIDLPRIERSFCPDITFTIFGPNLWRSKSIHLEGFAVPALLYSAPPYVNQMSIGRYMSYEASIAWSRIRIRRNKKWVVESETVKYRMAETFGMPLKDIFVVRNGVSSWFVQYFQGRQADTLVDPLGTILVPSAYYVHKNLELIPKIASVLKHKGIDRFRFLLTLPQDGEAWGRISRSAQLLGLDDHVATAGSIPHADLPRYYEQASAVFLPTWLECSSAVYPEAFVSRRPIVTSDLDFAREQCEDAALYFNPSSAESAAEQLLLALTNQVIVKDLVALGDEILRRNYSDPDEKWDGYIRCFEAIL